MLLYSLKQFRRLAITEEMVLGISVALGVFLASCPWNTAFDALLKEVPFPSFPLSYKTWLNEGLLSLFFAVLGAELRADFEVGPLKNRRKALFPLSAALGAVILPVFCTLLAVLLSPYHEGGWRGWGIPVASAPVLTLPLLALTNYLPSSIKSFVRAVLVFDDIFAILVLICFYGSAPDLLFLAISAFFTFWLFLLGRVGKYSTKYFKKHIFWLAVPLAALLWVSLYQAGIPASMAGLILGLTMPHRPGHKMMRFLSAPVSWIVLPLFAICNTSIDLAAITPVFFEDAAFSGPFFAFLLGKPAGMFLAIFLCEKFGLATPWKDKYRHFIPGVVMSCSLGFTVSLLMTQLAYQQQILQMEAETGIGFATVLSTFAAVYLLRRSDKKMMVEKAALNMPKARHGIPVENGKI